MTTQKKWKRRPWDTGKPGPIGVHGRGCGGPVYRNVFGVEYCSWCGRVAALVPVSRLENAHAEAVLDARHRDKQERARTGEPPWKP